MRVIKGMIKNLVITFVTYTVIAGMLFTMFGVPMSPYWVKEKIDTTDIERANMIMWDYPNIIFSAKDYIKQAYETMWNDAGLQLYYVAMYVPEDVTTEEQMLEVIWKDIKDNIYMDNAVYVCTSYYDIESGDERNDFFIYNHLLFGDSAKQYCNDFFMRTYRYYYNLYEAQMKNGEFYTYSDVSALALKKSVEVWNGVCIPNIINSCFCFLLFTLLNVITCKITTCSKKLEKDSYTEEEIAEAEEILDYKLPINK